ncbi:MAG: efflux RND transporter periplasmic adaptor subunit, partial [Armatimonadota bacterium]
NAPGVVTHTAQGRAVVTPPVEGKVTRLVATIGDRVRQGEPLAIIESADLAEAVSAMTEAQSRRFSSEADLRQAESEFQLSTARLRTAQGVLSRQLELARAGAFSQPSLQEAEKELNEAESELESAQKEEVVHRAQLERAERLFTLDLISRSELEQARLEVEQDRIRQEKAKRQIEIARKAYEREKQIAEQGILTAKEVQAAEAEVRAASLEQQKARIAVEAARAALQGARKGEQSAQATYAALKGSGNRASGRFVTIVAPIDGTVAERKVSVGQAVERSTELFEVDNLQTVWVTASVPERQIAQVSRGAAVTLTTTAYKGRTFRGIVQVLGSRLDPHTGTMPVQCLVLNSEGLLRPDMFAQVIIGVGSTSLALAVPEAALVREGEESFVYIEEAKNIYYRKAVKIGRSQGGMLEVLSGLGEGDRVVTKGAFVLNSEAQKGELKGHAD